MGKGIEGSKGLKDAGQDPYKLAGGLLAERELCGWSEADETRARKGLVLQRPQYQDQLRSPLRKRVAHSNLKQKTKTVKNYPCNTCML